jgi:hypothetical protein
MWMSIKKQCWENMRQKRRREKRHRPDGEAPWLTRVVGRRRMKGKGQGGQKKHPRPTPHSTPAGPPPVMTHHRTRRPHSAAGEAFRVKGTDRGKRPSHSSGRRGFQKDHWKARQRARKRGPHFGHCAWVLAAYSAPQPCKKEGQHNNTRRGGGRKARGLRWEVRGGKRAVQMDVCHDCL